MHTSEGQKTHDHFICIPHRADPPDVLSNLNLPQQPLVIDIQMGFYPVATLCCNITCVIADKPVIGFACHSRVKKVFYCLYSLLYVVGTENKQNHPTINFRS